MFALPFTRVSTRNWSIVPPSFLPSPFFLPLLKHFYKVDRGNIVETDAILYERNRVLKKCLSLFFRVLLRFQPVQVFVSNLAFERGIEEIEIESNNRCIVGKIFCGIRLIIKKEEGE